MRSISQLVFDERVVGAEAAVSATKETGKFDYDAPIEGMQAIDRYTIRLKLNHPSNDLLSELTTAATPPVPPPIVSPDRACAGLRIAHPPRNAPGTLTHWH